MGVAVISKISQETLIMKIEIYGTEWCGYCKQAKTLCESKAVEFDYIDVDDTKNLRALEERLGFQAKAVPQIFVDGALLAGGLSGLQRELANN